MFLGNRKEPYIRGLFPDESNNTYPVELFRFQRQIISGFYYLGVAAKNN
jgi:hypothetical protein